VWADPPYGMGLDVDFDGMFSNDPSHRKTGNRFEPVKGDDGDYDPRPMMELFADVKEQFWWGADYYADKIPGITDGVFIVWDKRCSEEMDKVVGNVFELVWSKQKHRKEIARILWSGHHGMQGDTRERVHPTQKPVRLVEWFLYRYGAPGDLILDPFLGSGPSIKAAEGMGRTVVGFELSPHYCDHIIAWGEAQGLTVERAP
jgi:site-specific DNA-methyltransferase (adenine-specific)